MGISNLFLDGYTIPKKLPKEEMYKLITKMSQGDLNARQTLIEHNIRLVIHQVQGRFNALDYDKRELVSIGILGLVKAIDTYNLSKKVEFSSYAIRCIDNEILMFIRKINKEKVVDSLDKPINGDDSGKEIKLEDTISSDVDVETSYENKEVYTIIRKIVYSLPEREREIIMLYFGFYNDKVYKQKEIAEKLNISRSYVSRLIDGIVNDIRLKLEELGIVESDFELRKRTKVIVTPQPEIKKEEEIQEETKGEKPMSKKAKTIYEYFNTYSKEQIDKVISELTEEERQLVYKRYGNDLSNPIKTNLTTDEYKRFYGCIISKIKRKLNTKEKTTRRKTFKTDQAPTTLKTIQPIVEFNLEEKEEQVEEPITKEDYLKMLELLRSPKFSKMLNKYSAKEKMIISLKLGYIDGKCFSTNAISEFLDIPEQEIISLTHKVLLEYQKIINSIFEGTIKMVTEKQEEKVFKKTKKEDF